MTKVWLWRNTWYDWRHIIIVRLWRNIEYDYEETYYIVLWSPLLKVKAQQTSATRTLTWIACIHSHTYINTVTTMCEAPTRLLLFSTCWVLSCFCNPPNSDMDYRIAIVRTWSFLSTPTASRHNIFDSEKLTIFFIVLLTDTVWLWLWRNIVWLWRNKHTVWLWRNIIWLWRNIEYD